MSKSYVTEIHIVENDWILVGYHDEPEIVAEQEATAKAAVEAGEFGGFAVDEYRVRRVDTSGWSWD